MTLAPSEDPDSLLRSLGTEIFVATICCLTNICCLEAGCSNLALALSVEDR